MNNPLILHGKKTPAAACLRFVAAALVLVLAFSGLNGLVMQTTASGGGYIYYYNQLNELEQDIYNFLVDNFSHREGERLDLTYTLTKDNMSFEEANSLLHNELGKSAARAMVAWRYDYPEIYWLGNDYNTDTNRRFSADSSDGSTWTFTIPLVSSRISDAYDVSSRIDSLASAAHGLRSDYDQVKAVHDRLAEMVSYHKGPSHSSQVSGPLIYGEGVCEGYAKAFKAALDVLGIPCILATGRTSEDHMWNYVYLEGQWYAVDVTNDDRSGGVIWDLLLVGSNTYIPLVQSTYGSYFRPDGAYNFSLPSLASEKLERTSQTYVVWFTDVNSSSYIAEQIVAEGGLLGMPTTPSREGYAFGGWYRDPYFETPWNFDTDVVYGDMYLYAKWLEGNDTRTVYFDSQGGSEVHPQTVNYGDSIASVTPSREGYSFQGWYVDPDYTDAWDVNTPVTADITLYALWQTAAGSAQSYGPTAPPAGLGRNTQVYNSSNYYTQGNTYNSSQYSGGYYYRTPSSSAYYTPVSYRPGYNSVVSGVSYNRSYSRYGSGYYVSSSYSGYPSRVDSRWIVG